MEARRRVRPGRHCGRMHGTLALVFVGADVNFVDGRERLNMDVDKLNNARCICQDIDVLRQEL